MRILLIEDEKLAGERLRKLVTMALPEATIEGPLVSVKKAVAWFQEEESPELIFMDIQLADGLSFEIFEQVIVNAPVIFTTAYDEYALKAFKVNSIDYLLKPLQEDAVLQAIQKYKNLSSQKPLVDTQALEKVMLQMNRQYKSRFMIKVGEHIHAIPVEEILYFYSEEKTTFLVSNQHKRYIIDYALDHVEQMVDPTLYFRTNRKFLVSFPAIHKIIAYSGSRLKLHIRNGEQHEILVSREKVASFKQWLDQ